MGGENVVYEIVSKTDKITETLPTKVEPPKGFGARHAQVLLLFICLTVGYMLRAQLSVSMVAMTDLSEDVNKNCSTFHSNRTLEDISKSVVNVTEGEEMNNGTGCEKKEISKWSVYRTYNWHKSTQEMIVFSFFVGYTSMQVPMGYFAQKFGGKYPIMVALAVNGIISLIIPWLPLISWLALCFCRLIQGMTQAAFYPSMHTLLGKWAPLSERSRLSTYVYTGSQFGTILIFQISGVFAGSPSLGWPATFWLCGVLSLLACGLLYWLGSSSPYEHPSISTEEMTFIMQGGCADESSKTRKTPWKKILTSKPVWGLIASHAGSAAGYILILTEIPTYMSYVLNVEIKKNGLYSSLPYMAMYVTALLSGVIADYAANKEILSIVNIRRIANSIGMVVAGLCLIGFSYVTSTLPAVCMLVLTLGLHSTVHVGFHINQIDLAPNFAGSIMAVGNMMANLTSLLVPVVVSNIVRDDMTNQKRWQIVFLIFALFQCLTNAVFVVFVKGTVQPWNSYDENDNDKAETNGTLITQKKTNDEKNNSNK